MTDTGKHTNGTWKFGYIGYGDNASIDVYSQTADGKYRSLARLKLPPVSCGESTDPEKKAEQEANAHLIAAAPELYEALERAQQYLIVAQLDASEETKKHATRDLILLTNALRKARGEGQQ